MVKTKRILTRAEEEDKKRLQLEKDATETEKNSSKTSTMEVIEML